MRLNRLMALCTAHAVAAPAFAQIAPILDLRDLTPDQGVMFYGEELLTFAFSRVVAGDINGDGFRDLIISAPFASTPYVATVYVVFGGTQTLASGFVDLAALAPPDGFVLRGPGSFGSLFGSSTTSGVDLNLDGIDDMIITGPVHSPDSISRNGQAFVIFGHPAIGAGGSFDVRTLDGSNGFVINGRDRNDFLGGNEGPVPTPDYNGDGYRDIVLVASGADVPGRPIIGQIYIIFWRPDLGQSGSVEVADLTPANSVTINGLFAGSGVGPLGDVGDFNADGIGDILWGGATGPPDRPNSGHTHVLFGGTPADENGIIESSQMPEIGGLVMYGPVAYGATYVPEPLGDINGDGVADHLVNDVGGDPVVFGGAHLNNIDVIDLGQLDGTLGFTIGPCCRNYKAAGDFDGDGYTDIVRQDHLANTDGRSDNGRANVAFGFEGIGASGSFAVPLAPDGINGFEIRGAHADDQIRPEGWVPDINGDVLPELVLQAQLRRPDGTAVGGGYIIYGKRRFSLGDFDRDRDVDMRDFLDFAQCYNGAQRPPADTCPPSVNADLDRDDDVDTADFAIFGQNYTGAR